MRPIRATRPTYKPSQRPDSDASGRNDDQDRQDRQDHQDRQVRQADCIGPNQKWFSPNPQIGG